MVAGDGRGHTRYRKKPANSLAGFLLRLDLRGRDLNPRPLGYEPNDHERRRASRPPGERERGVLPPPSVSEATSAARQRRILRASDREPRPREPKVSAPRGERERAAPYPCLSPRTFIGRPNRSMKPRAAVTS